MVSLNFFFLLILVSAVFEIFRKQKKQLFICTITLFDHTLYGKAKKTKYSAVDFLGEYLLDLETLQPLGRQFVSLSIFKILVPLYFHFKATIFPNFY